MPRIECLDLRGPEDRARSLEQTRLPYLDVLPDIGNVVQPCLGLDGQTDTVANSRGWVENSPSDMKAVMLEGQPFREGPSLCRAERGMALRRGRSCGCPGQEAGSASLRRRQKAQ